VITKHGWYDSPRARRSATSRATIEGDLDLGDGARLTASQLRSVTGYLSLGWGARLDAPQLTTVGGHVFLAEGAQLNAPNLRQVGGQRYDARTRRAAPICVADPRGPAYAVEICPACHRGQHAACLGCDCVLCQPKL
jgi:hypothetical protein